MKLLKAAKGRFHFRLAKNEKQALFQVLGLYPLLPVSHHELSKTEDRPDDQALLEDALADQRRRHKRQVAALMKSKIVFIERETGVELALRTSQMEWVLQVLNDIRVGAWLRLGSPDGPIETLKALTEDNTGYFWAMEIAGRFQSALVRAISGSAVEEE